MVAHPIFNIYFYPFPKYLITPSKLQDLLLRLGKLLNKNENSLIIITKESKEETLEQIKNNVIIKYTSPNIELHQSFGLLPYPKRLSLERKKNCSH